MYRTVNKQVEIKNDSCWPGAQKKKKGKEISYPEGLKRAKAQKLPDNRS